MRKRLQLDYTNMASMLSSEVWDGAYVKTTEAHTLLTSRTGRGNDFLGWINLPEEIQKDIPRILDTAQQIQSHSDVLVVIGIGGSYLGARAVIEAWKHPFTQNAVEIMYAGHHLDGEYIKALLSTLEAKRVSVNVVSKSGATTEPALAFRVLKSWMEKKYGSTEARTRIVATTDKARGALKNLADMEGYSTFVIPDDVGGRFSVLTAVGLLPIAVAGIDVNALIQGAMNMKDRVTVPSYETNPSFTYALLRTAMYASGKFIEVLASCAPSLQYVCEWWKQLFGESEGKEGMGIFPSSVVFTTDLHSMGQYIQDGKRNLFETFLSVDSPRGEMRVPSSSTDDGLEYLAGENFSFVNDAAYRATALAHLQGGVPNMNVILPSLTPSSIGELLYFFEYAVALSGYVLGVNPFDQPGVEAYKKNMFALLGTPGFEQKQKNIEAQLGASAQHIVE